MDKIWRLDVILIYYVPHKEPSAKQMLAMYFSQQLYKVGNIILAFINEKRQKGTKQPVRCHMIIRM